MYEIKNKSLLYQEVAEIMKQIRDLESASAVLGWDMETYMPDGSYKDRGDMISTIETLAHRIITSHSASEIAEKVRANRSGRDKTEKKMYQLFLKEYDRAAKIPDSLVSRLSLAQSEAQECWKKAVKKSDFDYFRNSLEELLNIKIEIAECLGYEGNRYDALLNIYEPGLKTEYLDKVFDQLRRASIELLEKVKSTEKKIDNSFFRKSYSGEKQTEIARNISRRMGFDFNYGRIDQSVHPFTTAFSAKDVRFTTKVKNNNFGFCLFSTIHETGHALYEQGIDYSLYRTFAARAASYGIHESQSLIWENNIARTIHFWRWALPELRKYFPKNLHNVTAEMAYLAINKIEPSLIRIEADELTYNLHIIIRYEIEKDLINKKIKVADIPAIWNEKMKCYLGIEAPDHTQGPLQDIHWAFGGFGYFPTYTLGKLYAAMFWKQMQIDIPDINFHIENGEFGFITKWLRNNIHRTGRLETPAEILKRVTGHALEAEPFIEYISNKISHVYTLI